MVYANDLILRTNSAKELEKYLNWLNNVGNKFYLRINLGKTVTRKSSINLDQSYINLKRRQLEVDIFSYHISVVTRN